MTEREYIDAVALARIRMAIQCLRDAVSLDPGERDAMLLVLQRLSDLEATLTARVKTK